MPCRLLVSKFSKSPTLTAPNARVPTLHDYVTTSSYSSKTNERYLGVHNQIVHRPTGGSGQCIQVLMGQVLTLSRSSRPRFPLPVAGRLVCLSSLSLFELLSEPPRFFVIVVFVDTGFRAASRSRFSVLASSLFSSVNLRMRSPLTQSSHLQRYTVVSHHALPINELLNIKLPLPCVLHHPIYDAASLTPLDFKLSLSCLSVAFAVVPYMRPSS